MPDLHAGREFLLAPEQRERRAPGPVAAVHAALTDLLRVREIFERHGEPAFRRLEREALEATLALPDAVVATGGGTVVFEANARLIRENGIAVWLKDPGYPEVTDPQILDYLRAECPSVAFDSVGSIRRGADTSGDIDILDFRAFLRALTVPPAAATTADARAPLRTFLRVIRESALVRALFAACSCGVSPWPKRR